MKKILFLLSFLIAISCSNDDGAFDQQNQDPTVWHGSAFLDNQIEVDTFGFRAVTGRLSLLGTDITNLNGLNALESIGGLKIQNTSLQSLDGLESLTTVEDPSQGIVIEIIDNSILTDLLLLSSISNYTNNLIVIDNNPSINLLGLGAANSMDVIRLENCTTSNFEMFSNVQNLQRLILKDIQVLEPQGTQGFNGISTVRQFDLNNVTGIEDLSGFENLATISGNPLRIMNCENLTSLDGLDNLVSVNGFGIQLENLQSLQSISALSNLSGDLSSIRLINLNSLLSLEGLNSIESSSSVQLNYLNSLTNLQGLNSLREVKRSFILNNMDNLITTNGLDSFEAVATSYDVSTQFPGGFFKLL